jgi:hypothetical protein
MSRPLVSYNRELKSGRIGGEIALLGNFTLTVRVTREGEDRHKRSFYPTFIRLG